MTRQLHTLFRTSRFRLTALTGAHFMVDLLGGVLPGFLPAALNAFRIDLGTGVMILTSIAIGGNLLQLPAARLSARSGGPGILLTGLALAGSFVLLAAIPSRTPVWALCGLMLLVGFGVALVHPGGLRGVRGLALPPSTSTPVFMIGGFLGFAMGPWIGSVLVQRFGLSGLYWLLLPLALVMLALAVSRITLPVELRKASQNPAQHVESCWSFRRLWIIAFLLNTGTMTISSLLPTLLYDRGFSLSFGGFSAMMFGVGSAAGSIGIGFLLRKIPARPILLTGLVCGAFFFLLYLAFPAQRNAWLLLPLAGAFGCSGFPQIVAMAGSAKGNLSLGSRMAMIVGGTWGMAGLAFLLIGGAAELWGVGTAIHCGWIFFLAAFLTAFPTAAGTKIRGLSEIL